MAGRKETTEDRILVRQKVVGMIFELVRDAKENFQVWKVSQIKTKGEIKDSLFKAIALVHSSWFSHYTVVGTGWFELGYAKLIFTVTAQVMHTGLTLVSIVDGSQSLDGNAYWFVFEYSTGVFNGFFTVMALGVLWMVQGCWLGMYGCTGVHNELFIVLALWCIMYLSRLWFWYV